MLTRLTDMFVTVRLDTVELTAKLVSEHFGYLTTLPSIYSFLGEGSRNKLSVMRRIRYEFRYIRHTMCIQ